MQLQWSSGILGFGLHISRRPYQLYDGASGVSKDVQDLRSSARALTGILTLVQTTPNNISNSELAQSVRDNIASCESGLQRLDNKTRKIQRLSSEPSILHVPLRLRYAFQEKTITKLEGIVHGELLGNLKLALAALNL